MYSKYANNVSLLSFFFLDGAGKSDKIPYFIDLNLLYKYFPYLFSLIYST